MSGKSPISIKNINQVGIVVKDIDKTMEMYWTQFGIGPWRVFSLGPGMKDMTYHGKPCSFSLKVAVARFGELAIELLQPLSGPTPLKDYLEEHGEGVQHLGIFVDNLDESIKTMKTLGYDVIMSSKGLGTKGDGGSAYFNTEESVGTLLEFIEMPEEMQAPERIYPEPSD
jgi:hypothetical protein